MKQKSYKSKLTGLLLAVTMLGGMVGEFSVVSNAADIELAPGSVDGSATYGVENVDNGFSDDTYQPAIKNTDGYYEIGNAGNLFWFAQQVNNDVYDVDNDLGFVTAKAVLTADIDLENRPWTPIGNKKEGFSGTVGFKGTFDGAGHEIKNLFVEAVYDNPGLFGEIRGATVKDLTVRGEIVIMANGLGYVGGVFGAVCGESDSTGSVVSNVHSYVNISIGEGVTVTNGKYWGGLAGYTNQSPVIERSSWQGNIDLGSVWVDQVGGIVGYTKTNSGTVIKNCLSTGNFNTEYVPGSYKSNKGISIGGIIGYVNSNSFKLSSSLFVGQITYPTSDASFDSSSLTAIGAFNERNPALVENLFYLAGSAPNVHSGSASVSTSAFTEVTEDEVLSGSLALTLGGLNKELVWGQNLDNGKTVQTHPTLTGAKVYYGYRTCSDESAVYTNISYAKETPIDHIFFNGICIECRIYQPAKGKGTETEPYLISNSGMLYWFAELVNSGSTTIHGKLTANIEVNMGNVADCGGEKPQGWRSWTPIGNIDNKYQGVFDGQNYTVEGLYFNDSSANYVGLFGCLNNPNGAIKNVGVIDSYFCGDKFVGTVVGKNMNGSVVNCYVEGTIIGDSFVGGIVGDNAGGIEDCYNESAFVEGRNDVGGIAGNNASGSITRCYNTADITGYSKVGGIVGSNRTGIVTDCYNRGNLDDGANIGGVVGYSVNGYVTKCYSAGGITAKGVNIGGIIGYSYETDVNDCYFDDMLYSGEAIGAFEGTNSPYAERKHTEAFASGEIAYRLGKEWGQKLGEEDYPVLGGEKVYRVYDCNDDIVYSNTNENIGHNYEEGACTVCGASKPLVLGDVNGDGDVTNADVLNIYKYIFNAELYPLDATLADVNKDGDVTNADVLNIYKFIFNPELYPLG